MCVYVCMYICEHSCVHMCVYVISNLRFLRRNCGIFFYTFILPSVKDWLGSYNVRTTRGATETSFLPLRSSPSHSRTVWLTNNHTLMWLSCCQVRWEGQREPQLAPWRASGKASQMRWLFNWVSEAEVKLSRPVLGEGMCRQGNRGEAGRKQQPAEGACAWTLFWSVYTIMIVNVCLHLVTGRCLLKNLFHRFLWNGCVTRLRNHRGLSR